jgi:VWFA-related protein
MKRSALAVAMTFALGLPILAQDAASQQQFQEQIDVNAVLLDVIVTDSKGHQILGLSKDDFIVKENGVDQPVDSVDYFTNRRLLDQREEAAPFKVERVREDRYFIFFFDKPQGGDTLFDEMQRARRAALDFVETMQPTDHVAVVGHDMRLKIYSDFSTDRKQLKKALDEVVRFGNGTTSAPAGDGVSMLRNMDTNKLIGKTGQVYDALDFLADSVRPVKARKNLVLFSPGIVDQHESIRGGMILNRAPELDEAIESLNASNVAVYAVQLQQDTRMTPVIHQRLSELSTSTGGHYFQFNTSFGPAVKKVEETNSGYYLVSYTSKKPRGEKGYQKVDVRLKNPEFRIIARGGYQFGT